MPITAGTVRGSVVVH